MSQSLKNPTLLLIDNYDSFTYNLVDYLEQAGAEVIVIRNDEYSVADLTTMSFDGIVISPGPETPKQAGITLDVIDRFHQQVPILGVCLGHQAIGMYFGAQLNRAPVPVHGKTSPIFPTNPFHSIFKDIPSPFSVMRYHSLIINDLESTPLRVLATTEDQIVMAIQHEQYQLTGFQFHPESILTDVGKQLLRNWLEDAFQPEMGLDK
jgi:anthranilate synthase/aminodeoxychorismate synthase-like glutamine amidotransferase